MHASCRAFQYPQDLVLSEYVLWEKLEGVEITSGIVTDNITGSICMRRFDNEYSYYYNDLVTEKKIPYKSRVDYENRLPHKGI